MSLSRRAFLAAGASAGAGLVIAFHLRGNGGVDAEPTAAATAPAARVTPNPFDAWLRLAADGTITLLVAKSEMGQGVFTSLPMILGDELGVDWEQIRIEQALTRPQVYQHGTGGSSSVRTSWLPLRQAGAAAREMLIQAAANAWQVEPSACRAERGAVIHDRDGRRASYAELIPAAAKLPVPDLKTVRLKQAPDFGVIGTSPVRRDIPAKVDGSATFGLDVRVPGMLFAVIARCPTIDGTPKRWDASKARQIAGVRDVFEIPAVKGLQAERGITPEVPQVHARGGVAVVAETTWAAIRGRQALTIEWDHGANVVEHSDALQAQFETLLTRPGTSVRNDGDVDAALAGAAKRIDAVYTVPFQAHATMEPMNCTVHVREDSAEAWMPSQSPQWSLEVIALLAKLPIDKVTVHTTFMGGAFGRRYAADWVAEATQISQRMRAPIQVVWTREDDFLHDFYRPASMHRLRAGFDAEGRAVAWSHRMVSTSSESYWPSPKDSHPERSEVAGAGDAPYAIPNFRLEYTPAASRIPIGWWRSVEYSTTAFIVESFIDEMATAAGVDPLAFRLRLLEQGRAVRMPWDAHDNGFDTRRLMAVLTLAAERAGWGKPLAAGRARGLACLYGFQTYVAEIAEVSIARGVPRVHRVTCAVDCGQVVHPDNAAAQIQGAVIYGLSATLKSAITIEKGQTQQRNFDSFPVIRMADAPDVDVHFVPSTAPPTGCGEPGLPPLAPAVANAIFALTGTRARRLPIRL
jgi:isoquinoline 1-oxidoreductase beta subunit